MTDPVVISLLQDISLRLKVMCEKQDRLEHMVATCQDALFDLADDDYDDEPLSQHNISEFDYGDDDDNDRVASTSAKPPPSYDSISSSTTKHV